MKNAGELRTRCLTSAHTIWHTLKEYGESLHRLAMLPVREVFPAHGKADNPFGWPLYHLDSSVIDVYDRGVQQILSGELVGKPYTCFLEDGLCAMFPVGEWYMTRDESQNKAERRFSGGCHSVQSRAFKLFSKSRKRQHFAGAFYFSQKENLSYM